MGLNVAVRVCLAGCVCKNWPSVKLRWIFYNGWEVEVWFGVKPIQQPRKNKMLVTLHQHLLKYMQQQQKLFLRFLLQKKQCFWQPFILSTLMKQLIKLSGSVGIHLAAAVVAWFCVHPWLSNNYICGRQQRPSPTMPQRMAQNRRNNERTQGLL